MKGSLECSDHASGFACEQGGPECQSERRQFQTTCARISLRVAPANWLDKARQLRKSANMLFVAFENEQLEFGERFERDPSITEGWPEDATILLLLGFAVENLLKGLFVSALSEPAKIKELKALGMPSPYHALEPLADAVSLSLGIEFSREDRDLLDVLEHAVQWLGRYPSPTNVDGLIPLDDQGLFKKFYLNYPTEHFAVVALYDRLDLLLEGRLARPAEP
jgi:hypothetical protein